MLYDQIGYCGCAFLIFGIDASVLRARDANVDTHRDSKLCSRCSGLGVFRYKIERQFSSASHADLFYPLGS